jgi:hypothetical protein
MADNGRRTSDVIFEGDAVRVSDMRRTCVATQDKRVGIRFDELWLARDTYGCHHTLCVYRNGLRDAKWSLEADWIHTRMHAYRDWYVFSDIKNANAVAACEVVPVLLILVIGLKGVVDWQSELQQVLLFDTASFLLHFVDIPPRTAKPAAEPHSFFLALRYT